MKHFSHGTTGAAATVCAIVIALGLSLMPGFAQEDDGSLDDMWKETQEPAKPAQEAASEKPAKKSKKSKKSKTEEKPPEAQTEQDLGKSPTEPSSGWSSPAGSDLQSSSTESSAAGSGSSSAGGGSSSSSGASGFTSGGASGSASRSTPGSASSSPSSSASGAASSSVPVSNSDDASSESTSASADDSSSESTVSKIDGPTQPLCKLSTLTNSDFVKSGGWPGVGPFTKEANADDSLVDESKNKLKVKLSGDDVTHAELLLVNQSPKPNQMLALQMTADFLLEAVGAQAGKIADFNTALAQNQEKLSTGGEDQVSVKAGTYVVQIQKKAAQDATVPGNISYLIALDNQKPLVASASTPKVDTTQFTVHTPNTGSVASTNTTPTTISSVSPTTKTPTTTTTTTPVKTTTPAKPPEDLLHKQFSNLIYNWQQIKRAAVKTRQSSSLTRILGGKALTTQNNAIEWLLNNKKYYEMTPLELKIQTYREITPGSKYEVDTFIKERRQLMNANTLKAEKDTTSSYNVTYTVEKIRGAWLITDTRMSQ